MEKLIVKILFCVFLILQLGCSSVATRTPDSMLLMKSKVLLADGYGHFRNNSQLTQTQNQLVTEHAAKLNAYRALAKQLYREKLDQGLVVADQVIKNEAFRIYLDLFLRGAKVIESKTILDQKKIALALNLTPRFYHCISSSLNVVLQCLQEDKKTPFTRIGYQQAPLSTVNIACASDCASQLHVSGFSKEKSAVDRSMLNYGFYDSEWSINIALRSALRYAVLTELIFN